MDRRYPSETSKRSSATRKSSFAGLPRRKNDKGGIPFHRDVVHPACSASIPRRRGFADTRELSFQSRDEGREGGSG